ncbi:hypothetical protein [Roseiterribacter gracilis]|uniref:Uncharacterized protein n=1 Tax=Roseiterribacter gracilis TaxID=2812848 RepID=A0A8S8XI07_9PROT|nr:hypothetical protein TMPK1_28070 [Rhodospirillales bacterium TMPK1]
MIRQAPAIFAAAVFALFACAEASAQQHPATTPASCKEPTFPKAPSASMSTEELNALVSGFQATQRDGKARYINCSSDPDWNKYEAKVDAYAAKLNSAVNAFNKANSRPTTTPASCTPVKKLEVPAAPTREQLIQLQADLKTVIPDFNERYQKCASAKDIADTKAAIQKAQTDFDAKVREVNAETERKNAEIQKENEEALRQQQEQANKSQRNSTPATGSSNSPGTRY